MKTAEAAEARQSRSGLFQQDSAWKSSAGFVLTAPTWEKKTAVYLRVSSFPLSYLKLFLTTTTPLLTSRLGSELLPEHFFSNPVRKVSPCLFYKHSWK